MSRAQWAIQTLAIVVGLTGASLEKFLDPAKEYGVLWYGIVVVSMVALFLLAIRRTPNQFHGKEQVNAAWRAMVERATQSVDVFAGDVSWSKANRDLVAERCLGKGDRQLAIQVLCRWPKSGSDVAARQVRDLLVAGAEVRFYSDTFIRIRGMVVDGSEGQDVMTALTVRKTPRPDAQLLSGVPGDDTSCLYTARRFVGEGERDYLSSLHQLFTFAWQQGTRALVLTPVEPLDLARVAELLRVVPHYNKIGAAQLSIRQLSFDELHAAGKHVKHRRLGGAAWLVEGYERYGVDMFKPCRVTSHRHERLLLPPIVEYQNGKYVVIDGHHRLYWAMTEKMARSAWCLVLTGLNGLPGQPVPFAELTALTEDPPRDKVFIGYTPEQFRDIDLLDERLKQEA